RRDGPPLAVPRRDGRTSALGSATRSANGRERDRRGSAGEGAEAAGAGRRRRRARDRRAVEHGLRELRAGHAPDAELVRLRRHPPGSSADNASSVTRYLPENGDGGAREDGYALRPTGK